MDGHVSLSPVVTWIVSQKSGSGLASMNVFYFKQGNLPQHLYSKKNGQMTLPIHNVDSFRGFNVMTIEHNLV